MFIKKYSLVFIGMVMVALFTGLPSLLFFERQGSQFQGIWPVFNADALFYHARIQDIFDGYPQGNHPYFWEQKQTIYPQTNNAETFVAFFSSLFSISVPALQVFFNFISPAVIFLLSFILFFLLWPRKLTAVFFPLLLYTIFMGGLYKPINPQITFPLLLLFLIFWLRLVTSEKAKNIRAIISGVLFGLLFLTYFFHWSFVTVLLGVHSLLLLFQKRYGELKYYFWLIGIGVCMGIPYFLRVLQGMSTPFSEETAVRVGVYFSHMPETLPRLAVAMFWLLLFVFFVWYYQLWKDQKALAVVSLLVANVVYPNHQLISGVIIQNAVHWSWMPIFIFSLSAHYMLGVVRDSTKHHSFFFLKKPYIKAVWYGVIIIFLFVPSIRLASFNLPLAFTNYSSTQTEDIQYYAPLLDWIQNNTLKDTVVLSTVEFMNLVPVYTHANVYYTDNAFFLPGSDEEIIERYLLSKFFDTAFFEESNLGVTENKRLLWNFSSQSEFNTHALHRRLGIPYEEKYSVTNEQKKVREAYEQLQKNGWSAALLTRYRLDYVFWDQRKNPDWVLDDYSELTKIHEINGVGIYILNV